MDFPIDRHPDKVKKNPVPLPIEDIAEKSIARIKEIRNFARSMPGMSGVVWIEVKEEIECLENRLRRIDTTLRSLHRASTDLKLKMADERALFETLLDFESLPPRGKEIVASSYFMLVVSDLKQRMQTLASRIEQLLNMQNPKEKPGSTEPSLVIRRVIANNQEIMCVAAAKIYNIHETVSTLANIMGLNTLRSIDRMSATQQDTSKIKFPALHAEMSTYGSFPGQQLHLHSGHPRHPFIENSYDSPDLEPPPLEPVIDLSLFRPSRPVASGPLREPPPRIDSEHIEYVGLPDLSSIQLKKLEPHTRLQVRPDFAFRIEPVTPSG